MVRSVTIAVLVIASLLVGVAIGWQVHPHRGPGCVGGARLHLQTPDGSAAANRSFTDLSARTQRVFLEAVTDPTNLSRLYPNPSTLAALDGVLITYRATAYRAGVVHTDCPV